MAGSSSHQINDHEPRESGAHQGETPYRCSAAEKAIRAVSSTIVFGIPLLVGTVTMLGYGVYKAYKAIKR